MMRFPAVTAALPAGSPRYGDATGNAGLQAEVVASLGKSGFVSVILLTPTRELAKDAAMATTANIIGRG
jgi:hypothetical protein